MDAAGEHLAQRPTYTFPALFAVEYALYALFACEACAPFAVVGHSVGDFVAACASGALAMRTALALVCERGRAMEALPSLGFMMAIKVPTEGPPTGASSAEPHCSLPATRPLR